MILPCFSLFLWKWTLERFASQQTLVLAVRLQGNNFFVDAIETQGRLAFYSEGGMCQSSISTFPVFHAVVKNFHARLSDAPPLIILTYEQIETQKRLFLRLWNSVSTEVIRIFMKNFSRVMFHPQNINTAQVLCLSGSCSLKFMSTGHWLVLASNCVSTDLMFPTGAPQETLMSLFNQ